MLVIRWNVKTNLSTVFSGKQLTRFRLQGVDNAMKFVVGINHTPTDVPLCSFRYKTGNARCDESINLFVIFGCEILFLALEE
jgi:hypothetical protein